MITTITKRDGRQVFFDINKIASAIDKAFQATVGAKDYSVCLSLAHEVSNRFEEKGITSPTVEQIQDSVERILIDHGYVRTAKAYILYRAERTRVRNMNDRLMKTFEDITYKDATDSDIKRENANIDGDTAMGTAGIAGGDTGQTQYTAIDALGGVEHFIGEGSGTNAVA